MFTKKYASTFQKGFFKEKSNFWVTFPPPKKIEQKIIENYDEVSENNLNLRKEATKLQEIILGESKKLKNIKLGYNQL